jgi:DNA-binding NarL/FixJ family response regulator
VLLVDDAAPTRLFLRRVLERCNAFEVLEDAVDSETALRIADDKRPGVILLDLDLPGTGGAALLPELRRVSPGSDIVVLSNNARRYGPALLSQGACGYIEKGLPPVDLVEALSEALHVELHLDTRQANSGTREPGAHTPTAPAAAHSSAPTDTPATGIPALDDDDGFDACTALVADDDGLTRRQVAWVLGHAGADVVLDTTAPADRRFAAILAGLAAGPAVVILGDLAGCDLSRLVAAAHAADPDLAVVLYRDDDPGLHGPAVTWVRKPDLEALEVELRRHLGTD